MTAPFRVEPLGPTHARDAFSCGAEVLDHYLARQASQDSRRRVSACFVAVEISSDKVAGYYTLAAGGVPLTDLPEAICKKLPRNPSVPVARIGRLAVDQTFHGKGLGGALLADAAMRASRSEVAVFALLVDAADEKAEAFYRHHGFDAFDSQPRQLMVSLKHIARKTE